jgi:uncharacterized protein YbaP (TraB family)
MIKLFRFLSVAALLVALANPCSAQKKEYQGRLWKISGNGLEEPSYLYGTMHVSRKVAFHLSDSFFVGLKNADIVALESDPSTWMDLFTKKTRKAYSSSWGGHSYSYGFYDWAFSFDFPDRDYLERMLRSENFLTNGMLYRSSSWSEEYEESTYLDLFIYQAGVKMNKRIEALENDDTVRYLEKLAQKPSESDLKKKRRYRRRYGMYSKIEDAYRDGDLDLLDSLGRLDNPTSHYHKYFIEERNIRMADRMDSLMREGKTLFTGVGAAHLPGDVGMINLLREMGYTLMSVTHEETKFAKKSKEKIEDIQASVVYKPYTATDGSFTVNVPGRLYEYTSRGQVEYYYPDMGNGAYYQVSRKKHNMNLQGHDQEYIMTQLDSLFFENIAGKILEQEIIEVDGFPGYDIINKTKNGDYQRHAIFVTPLEIFYFKASATGEYMKKESGKFISSVKFHPTKPISIDDGYTFSPPFGEFSLKFPAIPYYSLDSNSVESTNGSMELECFDPISGDYFVFMKTDLMDYYFIEEDTFELGRLAEAVAEEIKYDSISERVYTSLENHPVLTVKMTNEDSNSVWGSFITVGTHYYMMLTDAKKDKADAFFNSLELKDYVYQKEFTTYTDTNLYFTVDINYYLEQEDEFNDAYSYYRYYGWEDDEDQSYKSKTKYTSFTSPETGEKISVHYYKHHKYYHSESDSAFWKWELNSYDGESNKYPLHVSSKEVSVKDSVTTVDIFLTDTGSSKGIMVKKILKGAVVYTIATQIDTMHEVSPFVTRFFESFSPMDTTIGSSVFKDKIPLFISDLYSTDTVPRQHAGANITFPKFKEEHTDTLIYAIKNVQFLKKSLSKRSDIIEELGYIEDPKILPFLKQYYKDMIDTTTYQIAVLKALANFEDKESYKTFNELILEEAPLTNTPYDIKKVFYALNDSLELAASLYPDLLELSTYPEYKSPVYEMLSDLLDSSTIKPELYASQIRKITREAKDELKRQFSSEEDNSEYTSSYYSRKSENYDDILDHFSNILAPFYKDNESVQEFFRRQLRSSNKRLKMNTSLILLKNEVLVNDTMWAFFSNDEKLRADFYKQLEEIERIDLFTDSAKTQLNFARTLIINDMYSFDLEKDTIEYVGMRFTQTNDTSGYLYFYKVKEEEGFDWKLYYTGLMPLDSNEVSGIADFGGKLETLSNKSDVEKLMDDKVKEMRWVGRKRVRSQRRYSYYDNYFGFDY